MAAGSGEASFRWDVSVPRDRYRVYARWTSGTNRASNAPFEIHHVDGTTAAPVDQKQQNARWVLLGTFELDESAAITLTNAADGYVIADAIRVEPERYPERAP